MLKIVKKASDKTLGCDSTKVACTPLAEKSSKQKTTQTSIYQRIECGLNAFICGNGEMRRVL